MSHLDLFVKLCSLRVLLCTNHDFDKKKLTEGQPGSFRFDNKHIRSLKPKNHMMKKVQ